MRRLLALALILLALPVSAASLLGRMPSGTSTGSYMPLCSVGPTCLVALSTERQLVSGATNALQVTRSVDSTTQNVGFTAAGLVNTATIDTFCNAAVGGVISRNCWISEVFDQEGNTPCNIFNSTQSAMPNYMVSPRHSGLPLFQKAYTGNTTQGALDNNGGAGGTIGSPCNLLTGTAQALFFTGKSSYGSNIGGNFGLQENPPSVVSGAMFSAFVGLTGQSFDQCGVTPSLPCGGLDTEGQGPQANFTPGTDADVIEIATTAGGTGPNNIWMNGVQITTNETVAHSLVTQGRMAWGTVGDHTFNGPAKGRSEAFFGVNLTNGQQNALYTNEQNFIATLSLGYQGPGDLFVPNSGTAGLTSGEITQMHWLAQCVSLRKCYAGYEGPALRVCQGTSATCEDIGWVNNVFDVTTASAYCGPVSGLNNCSVQIWYNQSLNQASGTQNGVNTAEDGVAVSTSHRPSLLFSGCGTTTITVCIGTTATNFFTTGGIGWSNQSGVTLSAVAQRTGGLTSSSSIYTSSAGTGLATFIGFSNTNNLCSGSMHNGGSFVNVACADNTVHSMTYDATTAPSANLYVDGATGTPTTASLFYSTSGLGIGATGAGAFPCICQISEVLVYSDTFDSSFSTALGSTNVATLRANQRAAFGF